MAEKYPDMVESEDEIKDEELLTGNINKRQAEICADGLEKIIDDFHQLLNEDRKDVLPVTIHSLKRHTSNMFGKMKMGRCRYSHHPHQRSELHIPTGNPTHGESQKCRS